MALQSAFLLCARLERGRAELLRGAPQAAVARHYAAAWRRQFGARLRSSAVLAALAMRPRAAAPLLPLLRRWPGLLTVAAVAAGKVRPLAAPGEGGSAGAERRSMPERPGAHANVAPPPPLRDTR
jgi:hypothetical protein